MKKIKVFAVLLAIVLTMGMTACTNSNQTETGGNTDTETGGNTDTETGGNTDTETGGNTDTETGGETDKPVIVLKGDAFADEFANAGDGIAEATGLSRPAETQKSAFNKAGTLASSDNDATIKNLIKGLDSQYLTVTDDALAAKADYASLALTFLAQMTSCAYATVAVNGADFDFTDRVIAADDQSLLFENKDGLCTAFNASNDMSPYVNWLSVYYKNENDYAAKLVSTDLSDSVFSITINYLTDQYAYDFSISINDYNGDNPAYAIDRMDLYEYDTGKHYRVQGTPANVDSFFAACSPWNAEYTTGIINAHAQVIEAGNSATLDMNVVQNKMAELCERWGCRDI